jgi:hypothetical protein
MNLKAQITAIFLKAWRAYGQPTMDLVPPLASWSLPAGYAFDDQNDGITTTGGDTFTDLDALSVYFTTDPVYIVPVQETAELRTLIAAGVVPNGTTEVFVLQADVATARAAFAVELSGEWYNVVDSGQGPAGHPTGTWAKVRLERRA